MSPPQERDSCGSVLVVVLVVAAVLLILGSALAAISATETLIAHNQEQDLRLYYITEAGVEAALAALRLGLDCGEGIEGEIGGGGYTVTVERPPLDRDHLYYEQLQHLQPGSPGERLVISTGRLKGQEAAQVVIAELSPLCGKALAAADHLSLESSAVSGGLYGGEEFSVSGENFVRGVLRCAAPGAVRWADPESALTVSGEGLPGEPGGALPGVVTYSESRPLPEALFAPAPPLPWLNPERLAEAREGARVYPDGQKWVRGPPGDPGEGAVAVQGDLLIEPGPGCTFVLGDRVVFVEGDLAIKVSEGAAADIANSLFIVGGAVDLRGALNRDAAGWASGALFFSEGGIALSTADPAGEATIFGGSLLLCSKSSVRVGNGGSEGEFNMAGVIIAREVCLHRCSLCYDPAIYAVNRELFDLEVVIKEWIKPWKQQKESPK